MTNASDFPRRIEIEISSKCNMECEFCPRKYISKDDMGFMDLSLFQKIIDEACSGRDTVIQMHRRGESLLNPHFDSMLKYISGKCKKIQIATNGILMNPPRAKLLAEIVDFISFSMDTPESYCRKKGVDMSVYELAVSNIDYFVKVNKKAKVQVSMVKCDDTTEEDVKKFKAEWEKKVDLVRIYAEHSKNGNFGSLSIKRGPRKQCVKPFMDLVIFWDGRIARCNHDWHGSSIDNVKNKAIQEIWTNNFYRNLREQHGSLNIADEICSKCDSWYAEEGVQDTGNVFSAGAKDKGDAYGT